MKSYQKAEIDLEPEWASTMEFFLWKHLTAYYICSKTSITDVGLSYIYVSKNIEIFKVKLKWSKSSRLFLRVAFLVSLLKFSNCVTHFSVSFDFKIISWDNMILKSISRSPYLMRYFWNLREIIFDLMFPLAINVT